MKYNNKRKMFGLCILSIICFALIIFVIYVTVSMYKNPITKFNNKTSNYISFLFEDNNNHILEVKKPKIVSDEVGKLLFGEDIYTFEVNIDQDMNITDDMEYIVVAESLSREIDSDYVKVYITDSNGRSLIGDEVPLYSELEDYGNSGKILYTGKIGEDINNKLKIRVWISDEYKFDDVLGFSYHLNVMKKDS